MLAAFPSHSVFFCLVPVLFCIYTLLVLAAIQNPLCYHSLALPCVFSSVLILARISWINPLPCRSDSVCTSLGPLLVYLDYFSASPLDIVRRSKTHACSRNTLVSCPCHTCLLLFDNPACYLTMFINKSLHMDPLVSRLVRPFKLHITFTLHIIYLVIGYCTLYFSPLQCLVFLGTVWVCLVGWWVGEYGCSLDLCVIFCVVLKWLLNKNNCSQKDDVWADWKWKIILFQQVALSEWLYTKQRSSWHWNMQHSYLFNE